MRSQPSEWPKLQGLYVRVLHPTCVNVRDSCATLCGVCRYFHNLASVATAEVSAPPTREQLRQVYERTGGAQSLTAAQLQALCKQAGIADAVVAKVMEVGTFGDDVVDKDRFLFLMLAMSCEDFNRVVLGIFDVFSDNGMGHLETEHFCTLVSYLGPDMDPDVGPAFIDALRSDFSGKAQVMYPDAAEAATLVNKMAIQ